MAGFLERRIGLFTGALKVGAGTSGCGSYANFDNSGTYSSASLGRFNQELWLPATAFHPWGASANTAGASVFATASYVFEAVAGGEMRIPTISPSTTGSDARMSTTFLAPLNADTSGSIIPIVEMVNNAATSTPSSMGFTLRYIYKNAGASNTTAGSVQGTIAQITGGDVAIGTRISGSLPKLPSFAAGGQLVHVELQMLTGACTAGINYDFAGLRLKYIGNKFGSQSPE